MKKLLGVALALVVVVLVVGGYFFLSGPDLSAYERFRTPTVVSLPDQRVLVVEATGAPDQVAGKAFGALMAAYFALDGVPKGPGMAAPRARWPKTMDTPKSEWLGRYAMPIPDSVVSVPSAAAANELPAKIDTWNYGQSVAQVLHVGPYDQETPTIQRLHAFIKEQGLEIAGEHEEEYLRGPGMFGKGDPEKYYTLIRYPVRKPTGG